MSSKGRLPASGLMAPSARSSRGFLRVCATIVALQWAQCCSGLASPLADDLFCTTHHRNRRPGPAAVAPKVDICTTAAGLGPLGCCGSDSLVQRCTTASLREHQARGSGAILLRATEVGGARRSRSQEPAAVTVPEELGLSRAVGACNLAWGAHTIELVEGLKRSSGSPQGYRAILDVDVHVHPLRGKRKRTLLGTSGGVQSSMKDV